MTFKPYAVGVGLLIFFIGFFMSFGLGGFLMLIGLAIAFLSLIALD
jgi:hypothetical protein